MFTAALSISKHSFFPGPASLLPSRAPLCSSNTMMSFITVCKTVSCCNGFPFFFFFFTFYKPNYTEVKKESEACHGNYLPPFFFYEHHCVNKATGPNSFTCTDPGSKWGLIPGLYCFHTQIRFDSIRWTRTAHSWTRLMSTLKKKVTFRV